MHDEFNQQRMNSDAALAAALRALPAATPPRDGWELFAARVDRRRRVRTTLRIAVPAALAAGVALAVGLPHLQPARSPVPRVAQQAAPKHVPVTDLDALREQSRRLQAWVQTLDRGGAPLDGDALASAVALQDRIGLVDLQLSAARDPDTRAALWQQRNELLQRLGLLHLQTYAVAEHLRATPSETTIL